MFALNGILVTRVGPYNFAEFKYVFIIIVMDLYKIILVLEV